jgi:hypothetical protein
MKATVRIALSIFIFLIFGFVCYGNQSPTDVEKDGFKGKIKSIQTVEAACQPSANSDIYEESNQKQTIFYAKYDQNGLILSRMVDFERYSDINMGDFQSDNLIWFYIKHLYDHFLDDMDHSFNAAYIYDNQKNLTEIKLYAKQDLEQKDIPSYKAVNIYGPDQRISERNLSYLTGNGKIENFRSKFIYNFDAKNMLVKLSIYGQAGQLTKEVTFTLDKANNVIGYQVHENDNFGFVQNYPIKFLYDSNNKIKQADEYESASVPKKGGGTTKKSFVRRTSKFTYDNNGFLLERDDTYYNNSYMTGTTTVSKKTSIKYEYTFDQNGNPLTIKTLVLVDKFGKTFYQPVTVQHNTIT